MNLHLRLLCYNVSLRFRLLVMSMGRREKLWHANVSLYGSKEKTNGNSGIVDKCVDVEWLSNMGSEV